MTSAEFRAALSRVGHSQRGFASYVGCDERTVHRWAGGKQPVPNWVPVMLTLIAATIDASHKH